MCNFGSLRPAAGLLRRPATFANRALSGHVPIISQNAVSRERNRGCTSVRQIKSGRADNFRKPDRSGMIRATHCSTASLSDFFVFSVRGGMSPIGTCAAVRRPSNKAFF